MITTILLVITGLITLIFLHHNYIHNGILYNVEDFTRAINGLFTSHEGLIVILVILLIGILIGDMLA